MEVRGGSMRVAGEESDGERKARGGAAKKQSHYRLIREVSRVSLFFFKPWFQVCDSQRLTDQNRVEFTSPVNLTEDN